MFSRPESPLPSAFPVRRKFISLLSSSFTSQSFTVGDRPTRQSPGLMGQNAALNGSQKKLLGSRLSHVASLGPLTIGEEDGEEEGKPRDVAIHLLNVTASAGPAAGHGMMVRLNLGAGFRGRVQGQGSGVGFKYNFFFFFRFRVGLC